MDIGSPTTPLENVKNIFSSECPKTPIKTTPATNKPIRKKYVASPMFGEEVNSPTLKRKLEKNIPCSTLFEKISPDSKSRKLSYDISVCITDPNNNNTTMNSEDLNQSIGSNCTSIQSDDSFKSPPVRKCKSVSPKYRNSSPRISHSLSFDSSEDLHQQVSSPTLFEHILEQGTDDEEEEEEEEQQQVQSASPPSFSQKVYYNPFSPDRNGIKDVSFKSESTLIDSMNENLHISSQNLNSARKTKLNQLLHSIETDTFQNNVFTISRYLSEFEERQIIGQGSFGKVSKCIHKLDGTIYAVKQICNGIKGELHKNNVLKEVHALAQLANNPYVVRYYNSWIEDNHLFVQMEYCDGGNLNEMMKKGHHFSEDELYEIIRQVATGLSHIHSSGLVHLDIKPENIYNTAGSSYKIGDFGLVTSFLDEKVPLDEGDSRYLAKELLSGRKSIELNKVDVFSLGASIYELALGESLPQNGEEWHNIRQGILKPLHVSQDMYLLIKSMLHENPNMRPNCNQILHSSYMQSRMTSPSEMEKRIRLLESLIHDKEITIHTLLQKQQQQQDKH